MSWGRVSIEVLTMQNILHRYSRVRAGLGVVFLRLGLALLLLSTTQPNVPILGATLGGSIWWAAALIAGALVLGIATPIAAGLAAAIFLWDAYMIVDAILQHASVVIVSLSCMLIGGGPWSVDATLFGRKRIEIPRN